MKGKALYGDDLAKVFHVEKAPAFVTRTLSKSEVGVTEIKCDIINNGFTAPIPPSDMLLVQLQVAECRNYELWVDDVAVPVAPLDSGTSCFYDLRSNPVAYSISPFHSLNFTIPFQALDNVADIEGLRRCHDFDLSPGAAISDAVIHGLGFSLLPAFSQLEEANIFFVDHITTAITAHILKAYSGDDNASALSTVGLAPWQIARAKEMLDGCLDGDLLITRLAQECGMPPIRFERAFRRWTGEWPHQWLLRRRIEKAKDMMRRSSMPLNEIAVACGFANRRHLTRVFTASVGVLPSTWRRAI